MEIPLYIGFQGSFSLNRLLQGLYRHTLVGTVYQLIKLCLLSM